MPLDNCRLYDKQDRLFSRHSLWTYAPFFNVAYHFIAYGKWRHDVCKQRMNLRCFIWAFTVRLQNRSKLWNVSIYCKGLRPTVRLQRLSGSSLLPHKVLYLLRGTITDFTNHPIDTYQYIEIARIQWNRLSNKTNMLEGKYVFIYVFFIPSVYVDFIYASGMN